MGSEWIEIRAQAVPAHVGSPTPGCGYEDGDPYTAFLPPAVVFYSAALGRMPSTCFSVMAAGCPWYRTIPLGSTSIT